MTSITLDARQPYVVCALYKFVRLEDSDLLRQPLLDLMLDLEVRGTLLLAPEGINGTIAGTRDGIDGMLAWLNRDSRLAPIECKESYHDELPFYRSKVKLKQEIVTMGVEGIDPCRSVGTYVEPEDWNSLISEPDVTLVDTRNHYEIEIGTFRHALNPGTESFRKFPGYVEENLDPGQHRKVAMFCTGGIRCEKASAYLKERGFAEVYHLKGGILSYLEKVDPQDSLWEGECFVFDDRVAVNHQLQRGQYDQCYACRYPITENDKRSEHYRPGISCPRCYDRVTDGQRARFAERERQMRLAEARGEAHIGINTLTTLRQRTQAKSKRRAQRQKSNPPT